MKKLILLLILLPTLCFAQKQKVWLDADTGNEMDDVWAIIRLLWAKEKIDIKGLSSAHFNNADLITFEKWNQYETKNISPIKISQELNVDLLKKMNLLNIPHPIGADRQMGRAWGQFDARPSEASKAMLKVINELKPDEKLDILQLGASTNIASLIAIDTTVLSKIRLFSMGLKYDTTNKYWSKNDFNSRCDLNAQDFLLNQAKLDWTIITATTCRPYQYIRDEVFSKMNDKYPAEALMKNRWKTTNPTNETRTLWDLALIQAYLKPQFAVVSLVNTPPENHQHKVKIYSQIDIKGFYDDFWSEVIKNRKN